MFIELLLTNPIFFVRIIVILLISVSLHELAHGWVAITQGDNTPIKTGHMTMNPVVHLGWSSIIFLVLFGMVWGAMPVNPDKFRAPKWGNILVSAAGPGANLILGFISIGILVVSNYFGLERILSFEFFYLAAELNLVLFLFNLLPIPPLDGFRIFSEFWNQLKPLQSSPFGLVLFMILFMSGISNYLFDAADLIIKIFI